MDGIWGAATGKGVSYTPTELDPKTQQLIDASVTRATAPTEEIASKLNEGVANAGTQGMGADQHSNQKLTSMGTDPSMMQAIRNQYGQVANKSIQRIINSNNQQAPLTQANYLQQAYMNSMAQQNVATHNYEALSKAYSDSQMARGQLLASALSLGGSAGGMAMANHQQRGGRSQSYQDAPFATDPSAGREESYGYGGSPRGGFAVPGMY